MHQTVFVNRTLNMKRIKYIGLDMDHTLIRYYTKNFETLVYKIVIDKLINDKKYPASIRQFSFDFDTAIRGLIVDTKNGNTLKLSRYAAIRVSYHGTKPIKYEQQKEIYRSIYVDLKDSNYMAIDTSFSIAFCALYSQLIDLKDEIPLEMPDYAAIALDVIACVNEAHSDGSLKDNITKHLADFVIRDQSLVESLQRYIKQGKKFFILTNSDYFYTKKLLDYAINPFLSAGESWENLFEYVITLANKPRFFYDDLKFLAINPENGMMSNTQGAITPGIYQGGSARKFTADLQLNGDQILYIGDHIYGDILRLKKDCNWRTALVVEELGAEIIAHKNALPVENKINELMDLKTALEEEHIQLYTTNLAKPDPKNSKSIELIIEKIATIDSKITQLLKEERQYYNPSWGRIFRAGAEESYFAYQVDRFACIYMEKIADLLQHSPLTYFRAHRRSLPHDMETRA